MKKIQPFFLPALLAGVASLLTAGVSFADDVFVTNNGDNTVEEISNGVTSTFTATDLDGPTGIAVYGDNLYVANNANIDAGYVAEYSLTNGAFEGVVVGGLSNPRGITFDSSGDLFVANQSNGSIVEVPTGGAMATTLATGLDFPNGLTFDDGSLFVANGQGNSIDQVSLTGVVTPLISGLSNPNGLATGGGNLFETDNGTSTVLEFDPTGAFVGTAVSDPVDMLNSKGLAIDSAGDFWVTDEGDNSVSEYGPAGNLLAVYSTGLDGPNYITTLAVPEPSAYLLMLGGMGALFVTLRRRQGVAVRS
jgi:sugar lactone lactonase YvrE